MRFMLVALAVVRGLTPPLRICTVSTCKRNGGQQFFEAMRELSAASDDQAEPLQAFLIDGINMHLRAPCAY